MLLKTAMADSTSDDDLDFAGMMQGVTPIKHDKADIKKPKPSARHNEYRRAAALTDTDRFDQGLSDELRTLVDSEEALVYCQSGIQLRVMRKLKVGNPPWQEGLDLHGYTVDQARDELGQFIHQAQRKGIRSVIVVHGKAHNEDGSPAILKSYVNDWLRKIPQVLAFISAQPKDGGTGAVYVLLKSNSEKSKSR